MKHLDHDPEDLATERFFADLKKPPAYSRSFLDDVYGVLDGVKLGLGQAVMSRHLLKDSKDISIVRTYKPKTVEVVLHYFKQPYYSRLHTETRESLMKHSPGHLK